MTIELEPGIYRLTKALPAITPDKRVKRDWRHMPMLADTLFAVRDSWYGGRDRIPVRELSHLHGYAHMSVRVDEPGAIELVANLERVVDTTAREWFHFHDHHAHVAYDVLDALIASGRVTFEDFERIIAEARENTP